MDQINTAASKGQEVLEQTVQTIHKKMESVFPAFRLRTSLIASGSLLFFILFSVIVDSIGLAEGAAALGRKGAFKAIVFLSLAGMVPVLALLNGFLFIYLKPVHQTLQRKFRKEQVTEEEISLTKKRMDKFLFYLGLLQFVLFMFNASWGIELAGASPVVLLFSLLTKIGQGLGLVFLTVTMTGLLVMRRLWVILDIYSIDQPLRFFKRISVQNTMIPLVLIFSNMMVLADMSLRITEMEQNQNRFEVMHTRMEALFSSDTVETVRERMGDLQDEPIHLSATLLAKGYIWTILLLMLPSMAIIFSITIFQQKQLKDLENKIHDLAEGDGDLTRQIRITRLDELGRITSHLNRFIENLRLKLLGVSDAADRVRNSSLTLSDELQNTSAATEEMVASVEQINSTTGKRSSVINETSRQLISIIESLNQVSESVESQATFVEQTSSAINQMAASIQSVSQATGKANTLSENLSTAASAGGKAVHESIAAVKDVEKSSEVVNSLVSAITKIAGQTNMLAMNAAIEAAHAGDAGRGFAVVAEEVRNLAESSSDSAKQITERIQNMVGVVNNGVHLSENAGEALERVLEDISQTTELINSIALAMDEQNAGASEILNSISSLVEATHVIKRITQEQKDRNEEVRGSVTQITQAFDEIRSATEEQAQGTSEMIGIVAQLQDVADENQKVVRILSESFAGFKLTKS